MPCRVLRPASPNPHSHANRKRQHQEELTDQQRDRHRQVQWLRERPFEHLTNDGHGHPCHQAREARECYRQRRRSASEVGIGVRDAADRTGGHEQQAGGHVGRRPKHPSQADCDWRQQKERPDEPSQHERGLAAHGCEMLRRQIQPDRCEQDEREHRHAEVDERFHRAFDRIVNWRPTCRDSPGRPPIAGGGELNVPVM